MKKQIFSAILLYLVMLVTSIENLQTEERGDIFNSIVNATQTLMKKFKVYLNISKEAFSKLKPSTYISDYIKNNATVKNITVFGFFY